MVTGGVAGGAVAAGGVAGGLVAAGGLAGGLVAAGGVAGGVVAAGGMAARPGRSLLVFSPHAEHGSWFALSIRHHLYVVEFLKSWLI